MIRYYKCCCVHCYKSEKWEDKYRIHVHEGAFYRVCKCGGHVEIISYKGRNDFRREFICLSDFRKKFYPTGEPADDAMSSELTWHKYEIYQYIGEDDIDIGTIPVPSITVSWDPDETASNVKAPISSSAVYNPYSEGCTRSRDTYNPFSAFTGDCLGPCSNVDDGTVAEESRLPMCSEGCDDDVKRSSSVSIVCPVCGI